jgi:hypothetical protein
MTMTFVTAAFVVGMVDLPVLALMRDFRGLVAVSAASVSVFHESDII